MAADSTVVVSHEPWISDTICSDVTGRAITHGRSHNIYGMTYGAVARYDCGSRGHPNFPRQERMSAAKPRLADVIDSVETHVARLGTEPMHYNIEIKSRPEWDGVYTPVPPVFVRLVHGVVAASDVLDRTTIQSFDIRSLDAARQLGAAWQLALLTEPGTNLRSALARLGFTPHIYSPSFQAVDEPDGAGRTRAWHAAHSLDSKFGYRHGPAACLGGGRYYYGLSRPGPGCFGLLVLQRAIRCVVRGSSSRMCASVAATGLCSTPLGTTMQSPGCSV